MKGTEMSAPDGHVALYPPTTYIILNAVNKATGGINMKLTGELEEKVEKAENKEEAKQAIEDAGMILSDAELDQVAGGGLQFDLQV